MRSLHLMLGCAALALSLAVPQTSQADGPVRRLLRGTAVVAAESTGAVVRGAAGVTRVAVRGAAEGTRAVAVGAANGTAAAVRGAAVVTGAAVRGTAYGVRAGVNTMAAPLQYHRGC